MADSIYQRLSSAFRDARQAVALEKLFETEYNAINSKGLQSGALAIKAGGGVLVKTTAVYYGWAEGQLVTKAANTDMPALSGTVANAAFNVFVFWLDKAGTVTSAMGTAGATLAAVKFPPFPQKLAAIGFIIVNPTGTGPFIGNTTALDDATVVPNVVYINALGSLDQQTLIN